MNIVNDFLFSPELSEIFLGVMIGFTIAFILTSFFLPKVRQKTENKALKKTLARSTRAPFIFSIFFLIFFLLRLENSDSWIGSRIFLLIISVVAVLWIGKKVRFYLGIKHRIERAEKRRKKKK